MTPGDTMHLGLRDYNEMYPCPNGLPVQTGGPQASEAWQKRLAKTKQFIEQWNSDQRVERLTEAITDEQLDLFLELMKG
jgi:hypothetical protein